MNATFINNATKCETPKVKVGNWMMFIISYFIYVFNYKRWAAYIDDLIKKYNTKTSRDETKSCEPLEKSIDYSKINLSECKIPENFKPMTLNEVAAALLPEKEPLDEETNDEEIKDEDRDINEWYYLSNP